MAKKSKKLIYFFGEGTAKMKDLLGGKGANLSEMSRMGIPVPPGFTLTTETCDMFNRLGNKFPKGLKEELTKNLVNLEKKMGMKFGDSKNPLLLSVRSGAALSMPGMMDTVLNLGLNDITVAGLAKRTKNERFAFDAYRRFIQMFGDVVMGVEHHDFEAVLRRKKETKGIEYDTDLTADDLKELVMEYKELIKEKKGCLFPDDPRKQLDMSIDAVFGSWNNKRAIEYRRINDIKGLLGTAVNVQVMVFGNMGNDSGTGVAFTRNPATGENRFYGEYLMNAQGEDVVAGIRTPKPISQLKKQMPKIYGQLERIYKNLEKHYRDMQDMEFTIQNKKLYILQTRTGKRTARAALKIAVDMVNEKLIDKKTAVGRVKPEQLNQLLHKQLDPIAQRKAEVIAKGLPASPGAAVGMLVFTAERAVEFAEKGEKVILAREETSPEDIAGMNVAQGILTARGGMTSHAAVVARGMGKCCIAGCSEIIVNAKKKEMKIGSLVLKEGDYITMDGGKGDVFNGRIPVVKPELSGDFGRLMKWADEFRVLGIRTNADTPHDAKIARDFGAEGIGLTRTERHCRITP